jgi:predicted site-specific integrase-resolvase
MEPLLLKPQDAFRRIGVARDVGYRLIAEGRLRVVRLSERRILVPVSECDAFVERELAGQEQS